MLLELLLIYFLAALFVGASIADVALTRVALNHGGYELNPIPRLLFHKIGFMKTSLILKVPITAIVLLQAWYYSTTAPFFIIIVLSIFTLINSTGPFYVLYQIVCEHRMLFGETGK